MLAKTAARKASETGRKASSFSLEFVDHDAAAQPTHLDGKPRAEELQQQHGGGAGSKLTATLLTISIIGTAGAVAEDGEPGDERHLMWFGRSERGLQFSMAALWFNPRRTAGASAVLRQLNVASNLYRYPLPHHHNRNAGTLLDCTRYQNIPHLKAKPSMPTQLRASNGS